MSEGEVESSLTAQGQDSSCRQIIVEVSRQAPEWPVGKRAHPARCPDPAHLGLEGRLELARGINPRSVHQQGWILRSKEEGQGDPSHVSRVTCVKI